MLFPVNFTQDHGRVPFTALYHHWQKYWNMGNTVQEYTAAYFNIFVKVCEWVSWCLVFNVTLGNILVAWPRTSPWDPRPSNVPPYGRTYRHPSFISRRRSIPWMLKTKQRKHTFLFRGLGCDPIQVWPRIYRYRCKIKEGGLSLCLLFLKKKSIGI